MACRCRTRERRALLLACALAAAFAPGRPAAAEDARPYVPVESDLLVRARPDAGLLVLHSGYRNHPLVDADAVVWLGAGDERDGDVLTANVGFREPHGLGQGRVGRLVLATGAVRPVHVDGAIVMARAPSGSSLELFAGVPVVPEFGERAFDWLAGARAAQWLWRERLGVGASYLHRRDAGQLAGEEVGADLAVRPLDWLALSGVIAWDAIHSGLADARVSARAYGDDVALETFASRRVAARLLPATSLFSTVSDTATSDLGADLTWYAFPRLDLGGTLALESAGHDLGYRAGARARLRLDDEGRGDLRGEADRRELDGTAWTALRVASTVPLTRALSGLASVELVRQDDAGDDGSLWPWARVGASWAFGSHVRLAAAYEAKASPEYRFAWNTLLRVSFAEQVLP